MVTGWFEGETQDGTPVALGIGAWAMWLSVGDLSGGHEQPG